MMTRGEMMVEVRRGLCVMKHEMHSRSAAGGRFRRAGALLQLAVNWRQGGQGNEGGLGERVERV